MEILLPTLVAFILSALATGPTIKLAKKLGLVDNPKERPHPAHIHQRIIPRAGGIPIFLGVTITMFLFLTLSKHLFGIFLGGLILLITGLIDDKKYNFSPYLRLLLQFLAAAIVVISGIGITYITNPLGGILRLDSIVLSINLFGIHSVVLIADLLALFWIVWMMNMVNWSKGIDGIMPGIITVTAVILGILSYNFYLSGDPNQLDVAKLSFITAGSALAFLFFNWYPAKIFPGFSGSNLLGFLIAILAILSGAKLATAGLVLIVPITDFVYTFFRRMLQGKSPVWADRGHLYHRLLDKHISPQKIALFYILGSAILGAAALSLNSKGKLFATILIALGVFGLILWLNFFGHYSKKQDQDNG